MYRKRPMDLDGAQGACRPLFDVVRSSSVRDDAEAYMERGILPVIVDRNPRTRITLEFEYLK